jgi:uncharacterized membrane protein
MKNSTSSTGKMVRLAVLAAVLIVMGFTPLWYLKLNPVMTITFNMIPVVIGAIILGPTSGAILGGIFGLTSFAQALTGADALGVALLNQSALSAILLFIMCFVPRVLAGWLPGLVFRAVDSKLGKSVGGRIASVAITALSGSVFNTIFFVAAFVGFFATNDLITGAFQTTSVWAIITILITVNALVEAIVCTIIGGAVGRALIHFIPVRRVKKEA